MQHKTLKDLHRTLEICCYVAGAGAFGVFVRWLQDQLAFNDQGLAERSFFHVLVVLYLIAAALLFLRFIDQERNKRRFPSEDFCETFANPGRLYAILRWAAGGLICLGSLILVATCETDEDAVLLRILAALAFCFGLSYPWLLSQANKPPLRRRGRLCAVACLPVLFFSFWLVVSYKANSINSVIWSYVIEFVAIVLALAAFFRLAGFFFDSANGWRTLFFCMISCSVCIMTVADARYFGMQLMFLGTAALQLLCCWILLANLRQGEKPAKAQPDDGFDRLGRDRYEPPEDGGFDRL